MIQLFISYVSGYFVSDTQTNKQKAHTHIEKLRFYSFYLYPFTNILED